jgi:hypothetical protein
MFPACRTRQSIGQSAQSLHQPRSGSAVCARTVAQYRWVAMTTASSDPTPQRLAAIRDQLKLLADYL